MKQVELETIEEYLQLIKQNKEASIGEDSFQEFLFRGQTIDSSLLPKICRLEAKGDKLQAEKRVLEEFKRTNPLLIKEQWPLDDWDYLSLGQHFGLPTRLLDWTNNALTALWFATGESNSYKIHDKVDAVVWILMVYDDDFIMNKESTYPFEVPSMKIVRPRVIKQRINNQSGLFSISSSDEVLNNIAINKLDAYDQKLTKVKIPSKRLLEIRTDLNSLGINAYSIFPELEGLCNYLQWLYFK